MTGTTNGLTILLAVLVGQIALAEPPATQPAPMTNSSGDSADLAGDEARPKSGGRGDPGRHWSGSRGSPTDEQWSAVIDFMKENSPRRAADVESLQSEPRGQFLRSLVANRYDYLMSLKNEDPSGEIYAIQLKKLQVEDGIYGLLSDAQKAGNMPEADKTRLRDLVTQLIDVNFKEREHRIKRVRESLDKSEKSLTADKGNRNAMIEDRVRQFMDDGPGSGFSPRPPGPGDGPRRRPEDRPMDRPMDRPGERPGDRPIERPNDNRER